MQSACVLRGDGVLLRVYYHPPKPVVDAYATASVVTRNGIDIDTNHHCRNTKEQYRAYRAVGILQYDTIGEFNVDSKAECDQLNLAHETKTNNRQCPLSSVLVQDT